MATRVSDRTWVSASDADNAQLPTVIIHSVLRFRCDAVAELPDWGGVTCDRPRGHTGRHNQNDGTVIFAVWED
jgi:hypothetical protein